MAYYEYTGRSWNNTGRDPSGPFWIHIEMSNPSARVNGDHWTFEFYCKITSEYYTTNIANLTGATMTLRAYKNSNRTGLFAETTIPITGSLFGNGTTEPFGPLRLDAGADVGAVYFEFDANFYNIPQTGGHGIEDVGYGYIHNMYEYGTYHVEDIPLNPVLTNLQWDESKISHNSVSYYFTASQPITEAKGFIVELDSSNNIIDQSSVFGISFTGNGTSNSYFTIGTSHWDKITYAKKYSIRLSVKNADGRWNESTVFTMCSAYTGNIKPVLTLTTKAHLDWSEFSWTSGVPVNYSLNYPSCTGGTIDSVTGGDRSASGGCLSIRQTPETTYTFKVQVYTARHFPEAKFGSYESIIHEKSVKTLNRAKLISPPTSITFADVIKLTMDNTSERQAMVDVHRGTVKLFTIDFGSADDASKEYTMSQGQLDTLYKMFDNTTNSIGIFYRVKTFGAYNTYDSADVNVTVNMKGNHKTARVGVANIPRRSNSYIGINGTARRCIVWVGDANGKPRRCT